MADVVFGVFSRDRFPKKCAEGLPVYECDYTYERLKEAAQFEPDEPLRGKATQSPSRWNRLYPPKVSGAEDGPKQYDSCRKCGRMLIVGFQMEGDEVQVGTRVKLEYRQPSELHPERPQSEQGGTELESRMLEPAD